MKKFQYVVQNPIGLHARPASDLIMKARIYDSSITLVKGNKMANPKSLLSILGLNVNQGDEIVVLAEGDDEDEAIAGLREFFEGNL